MSQPARTLSPFDAVTIILGIVIGSGIFKTPSAVAALSGSVPTALLLWLLGGAVSFIGALCYAELTTCYPDPGGDYHFIRRAFGSRPAFLFAWARMTVIQTGSIAMLAFIIGDYASEVYRLGNCSASWYAALAVVLVTGANLSGIRHTTFVQNLLTSAIVLGIVAVVCAGLSIEPAPERAGTGVPLAVPGKAMIFVLLTYGGWNEAAYISAELRQGERNMTRVLLLSIGIITGVYLAANAVFLTGLGLAATARSETVAADLMRAAAGDNGARFISVLIVTAAFSGMNAAIMTGARSAYALGRDFPLLGFLGTWNDRTGAPANALLLQAAMALLLVALGTATRTGFSTMVEYTAPVFWFFFLLTGVSLIVLRAREPGRRRPFGVPFYPVTPVLFCAFCLYLFRSSLSHAGAGALAGVSALACGIPLMCMALRKKAG